MLGATLKSFSEELDCNILVECVPNPIEGLYKIYELLVNNNYFYHMLLIDENLPYFKGNEFIEIYKKLISKGFYEVPLVSISGDISGSLNNLNYFDFYLGKPSKKKEMFDILKKVICKSIKI